MPLLSAYSFEAQFHAACVARLRALIPAVSGVERVWDARSADLLPAAATAKIVVEASPFARASGHMSPGTDGRLRYDHFRGQITITLSTEKTTAGGELHDQWLGLVRECFLPERQPLAAMPYQILQFEETGGSITYIADGERLRSELVFTAEIGLRPGSV
jgi:hypothetical protein